LSDARVAIVGVGNLLMGDDGLGPRVIAFLKARGLDARAELRDAGLAFGEVLCEIEPEWTLVVIDAVRGGGEPGSIYRIDPADIDGQTGTLTQALSLHEVNVLPILRMEALAGRAFRDVTIFGVEPERVDWSEELSPTVSRAAEKLVELIVAFLDERAKKVVTEE